MENEELLKIYLQKELSIEAKAGFSINELTEKLAEYINGLINNNFQQLIGLLYKIDVNETKLRSVLKEKQDENAGKVIAQLIIERQMQKIKSRQEFQRKDDSIINDEEKW
jgi:hypothetical protein